MTLPCWMRRSPSGAWWVAAVAAAAFLALSSPVLAQDSLAQADVRYRVALTEHAAAVTEVERVFSLWEQAGDRVGMARAGGDDDELEDALAAFQERAIALTDRERAQSQAVTRLRGARDGYLDVLNLREEQILAQLDTPMPSSIEQSLMLELVQVRARVDEVEEASGTTETITLRPVPELGVDPRDSLDDLFAKENLMQDVAASYDAIIAELQEQVMVLEREVQRTQSFEELRRSVERFGGDFVPGAPLPPPPTAGAEDPTTCPMATNRSWPVNRPRRESNICARRSNSPSDIVIRPRFALGSSASRPRLCRGERTARALWGGRAVTPCRAPRPAPGSRRRCCPAHGQGPCRERGRVSRRIPRESAKHRRGRAGLDRLRLRGDR